MALTASPPPSDLSPQHQELSDQLDEDIARVRAEIESLTRRKTLLASSLLSSTKVQARLASYDAGSSDLAQPSDEQTPLQVHSQHNQTNIHRLAYGVTSFLFTDPNPDASDRPLLGIRFDIPSRSGKFEKAPYYIFLKRNNQRRDQQEDERRALEHNGDSNDHNDLSIHHHTVPALVPLQEYEARYLPQPAVVDSRTRDEGYFSPSADSEGHSDHSGNEDRERTSTVHDRHSASRPTQDLHGLVAAVRRDLVSWQLRHDTISLLSEGLGLSETVSDNHDPKLVGRLSVQSIEATAVDARFCRLVWQNGTVGRLRLTDDGYVDRAVIIGDIGEERQPDRMRDLERILCTTNDGGRLNIGGLSKRLEVVERRMQEKASKVVANTGDVKRQGESTDVDGENS